MNSPREAGCSGVRSSVLRCPRLWSERFAGRAMAALLGCCCAGVLAADFRVLCPHALREPVLDLARSFARASGHRVEFQFASVGAIHKRVAAGERADMAIGTAEGVDALIRLGPGLAGSEAVIARSALAVAVRRGAAAIEIASPDALARAFRAARSISAPDPRHGVPGGAQAAELLSRLRLDEELDPRIRWLADAREAGKRVASGETELAVAAMSDLLGSAEVVVSGPILEPATQGTTYAAVVTRSAANPDPPRAFIGHLRSPQAASVFRRAGYIQ